MTIRHLKIFIAVAETGKMSLAAKALYLTQPTISQAVHELEEHYHTQLFDRLSKRLYITESGQKLLELARSVVHAFEDLEARMQDDTKIEHFRIGATVTVGSCLLPSLLENFRQRMPLVDTCSFIGNTATIEEKLLRSELDAAVVEGVIKSPDLISIPMVEDYLVLACASGHPFAVFHSFQPKDLEGMDFVMREKGSGTRKLFEQYLSTHNIHIHTAWEANCPRTILNAVIYNDALAVMSQRLVKHECMHQAVKIFRYENDAWDRYFKLVFLKRHADAVRPSDGNTVCGKSCMESLDANANPGITSLHAVLERYRFLQFPKEIPACTFKNDIAQSPDR